MTNGKHPHAPKSAVRKKPAAKVAGARKKSTSSKTMTKGMKHMG